MLPLIVVAGIAAIAALVLLQFTKSSAPRLAATRAPRSDDDSGKWTLAKGNFEGNPAIVRTRTDLDAFDRNRYQRRIHVCWTYGKGGAFGLPTDRMSDELTDFENRLVPALESERNAVMVAVVTTNGTRDFIFYTKDADHLGAAFNSEFGNDNRRLPVQLSGYQDKAWAEYDGIVANQHV